MNHVVSHDVTESRGSKVNLDQQGAANASRKRSLLLLKAACVSKLRLLSIGRTWTTEGLVRSEKKSELPETALNAISTNALTSNLSLFLNMSRWVGAFLVLIFHVRHIILVDFKEVEHRTLFDRGLYFVTGLGHEAVVIFFVISGFLVGGLTLDRWRTRGPDLRA